MHSALLFNTFLSVRPSVRPNAYIVILLDDLEGASFSFFGTYSPLQNSKGNPPTGGLDTQGYFFSNFDRKMPFVSEMVGDRSMVTTDQEVIGGSSHFLTSTITNYCNKR